MSLGKELHAIELARQDKDIGQRIVELNIEGIETFVTLSIYGKALKHKAFKFIKSLFDNPHYNNFRKLVYADQIGMYNDKNHNQSKICFFYKNTGIEKIYTLEDYSRLISIFIEQKVDLSLIPSLYERSPELFGWPLN